MSNKQQNYGDYQGENSIGSRRDASTYPVPDSRYKDTVFRMLFKEPERLLELYNAMAGTDYRDPNLLEIVTLESAIYMKTKNDLAFVIDFNLWMMELQALILNINEGYNEDVKEQCRDLKEYMQYVDRIRGYIKDGLSISDAVERSIAECIWEDILREFLEKNRAEVQRMSIYEFDEEAFLQGEREYAYEAGERIGFDKGYDKGVATERKNTEWERARAEEERAKAEEARERAEALAQEVERLRKQLGK